MLASYRIKLISLGVQSPITDFLLYVWDSVHQYIYSSSIPKVASSQPVTTRVYVGIKMLAPSL